MDILLSRFLRDVRSGWVWCGAGGRGGGRVDGCYRMQKFMYIRNTTDGGHVSESREETISCNQTPELRLEAGNIMRQIGRQNMTVCTIAGTHNECRKLSTTSMLGT